MISRIREVETARLAPAASILIVDDEPIIRGSVAEYLHQEGFSVRSAGSGEAALSLLGKHRFDVLICDVNLPGIDGIEVLERVLQISSETFVLLITAYATVETAIDAFQKGAHDYLMKPIILHEVLAKLQRIVRQREILRENQLLRRELNRNHADRTFVVGGTPAMKEVWALARKAALSPTPIMLVGENGTGKELLARTIHQLSFERKGAVARFIAVNCSAASSESLDATLFGRQYSGETSTPGVLGQLGTVFLDEICDLPHALQAKLRRAIDGREMLPVGGSEPVRVAARVVAATDCDAMAEVESGRFREDLFYCLGVVMLKPPALRERREDIPELVELLLAKHAQAMGKTISGTTYEAMRILQGGPWRGNIRELDNALQRAVILSDGPLIVPADLPSDLAPRDDDPSAVDDLGLALQRFEKLHIERLLRQTQDKREAARRLGIGLSSLYRKIEQQHVNADPG